MVKRVNELTSRAGGASRDLLVELNGHSGQGVRRLFKTITNDVVAKLVEAVHAILLIDSHANV